MANTKQYVMTITTGMGDTNVYRINEHQKKMVKQLMTDGWLGDYDIDINEGVEILDLTV